MFKKTVVYLLLMIPTILTFAQVENVQLGHPVYEFIKEMKVKHIVGFTHDDDPGLSKTEVQSFLKEIESKMQNLSTTEKSLLKKYQIEFFEGSLEKEKHWQMFNYDNGFVSNLADFGKDKVRYMYAYKDENVNAFLEATGHLYIGQKLKPGKTNAELYDIGFRFRGTLLDKLGFYFTIEKGGISGNKTFASVVEPRLKTNFKFIEDSENIGNYDFVNGYLRYFTEPAEDMHISLQLGREQIKFGYGYGSKLIISGDNPNMDFLKFNFKYGFFDFTSIHASTVGEFNFDISKNFTKFIALNKFGFLLNDKFRFSIGESVVYSGRGLELAYLNPFIFYKFVEISLQDRDNGTVFFEVQSNHIKNLELQATFFMDENFITKLGELSRFSNKTAYQVGTFWYNPFSINDLSLILEYTKIRPYVYSHVTEKNSYTSFNTNLGHRIGPNSDEIFTKLSYNLNDWIRLNAGYSFIRSGENIIASDGTVIKNVGGDISLPHDSRRDSEDAPFLDGVRINSTEFLFNVRLEPIREVFFDLYYNYRIDDNITENFKSDISYAYLKMTLEF